MIYHAEGKSVLYSEPEYDKNNMYIDMLKAFESKSIKGGGGLATLKSASEVVRIIDAAKKSNQWTKKT